MLKMPQQEYIKFYVKQKAAPLAKFPNEWAFIGIPPSAMPTKTIGILPLHKKVHRHPVMEPLHGHRE